MEQKKTKTKEKKNKKKKKKKEKEGKSSTNNYKRKQNQLPMQHSSSSSSSSSSSPPSSSPPSTPSSSSSSPSSTSNKSKRRETKKRKKNTTEQEQEEQEERSRANDPNAAEQAVRSLCAEGDCFSALALCTEALQRWPQRRRTFLALRCELRLRLRQFERAVEDGLALTTGEEEEEEKSEGGSGRRSRYYVLLGKAYIGLAQQREQEKPYVVPARKGSTENTRLCLYQQAFDTLAAGKQLYPDCKEIAEVLEASKCIRKLDFMTNLPEEVTVLIFSYLREKHLKAVSLVCRRWYQLSCDDLLWKRVLDAKLALRATTICPDGFPSVKAYLKAVCQQWYIIDTIRLHFANRSHFIEEMQLSSVIQLYNDRQQHHHFLPLLRLLQGVFCEAVRLSYPSYSPNTTNARWMQVSSKAAETLLFNLVQCQETVQEILYCMRLAASSSSSSSSSSPSSSSPKRKGANEEGMEPLCFFLNVKSFGGWEKYVMFVCIGFVLFTSVGRTSAVPPEQILWEYSPSQDQEL
ncbi:hypothetical protein QOT17_001570 [Balamuthia mandrillaris]